MAKNLFMVKEYDLVIEDDDDFDVGDHEFKKEFLSNLDELIEQCEEIEKKNEASDDF